MKIFNNFSELAQAKVLTGTPVRILKPALIDGVAEASGEGLSLLSGNVFVAQFNDQEAITARKTNLLDDSFTSGVSAYINRYSKDSSGNWVGATEGKTSSVFYNGQIWWPLVEIPYTANGYLVTAWGHPTGNPDILEVSVSTGAVIQFNRFSGLIDGISGGGGSIISEVPPTNPLAGVRWTRCSDMRSFIWYVDVDGSQWVEDHPSVGFPTHSTGVDVSIDTLDGPSNVQEFVDRRPVSILTFGGVDDDDGSLTTTNNLLAFSKYFTYLNSIGGGTMYLPKTNTGGYFINGDDTTQVLAPIEVFAEEGVYLRIIYSGGTSNSPFANNNLKYNRELTKIQQNFGFTNYGSPSSGALPSEHLPTITQAQGIYSEPRVLVGTNFSIVDLDNPDTILTPISQSSDSVTFEGTGRITAAIKASKIGEEVFSLMSNPVSGVFLAGVKTLNGYSYYSQDSGTQVVNLVEGTSDLDPIVIGVQYSLMDQQRDLFNNALMSIRVISARRFSVLANGLVVGTHKTRSNITGVIFGSDNIAGPTSISQFSAVRTNSTGGSKPLRIVCLGDSISDNDVQYSPYRLMSSILQSQGQQIGEMNNLSKSGEVASQQYARLLDIGVGYDYCLIQVGVNDIQGTTPFAAFSSTIKAICERAKLMGMIPIVGLPTQFYSKDEANAHGQTGGQDTANNAQSHTYKSILIRAVAEVGGLVNLQSMKNYGAITASWLDYNTEGVQTDSVLVDNIHPTPYGASMLGLGWAESVLGSLHMMDDTDHILFESIPTSWLQNGFGLNRRPTIRNFIISGEIDLEGGNPVEGNPFMKLPPHLKLNSIKMQPVTAVGSAGLPIGTANLYIGVDGNCYGFNVPANTVYLSLGEIDLSDVTFV